jgi:phosphoribosylformimino-5-aminoimidazole carboxamide ribotide isomerase
VLLSIDAKRGEVAIEGWREVVSMKAVDLAREFEGIGLSAIIFTDIERDGMETGLNWEMTRALARSTSLPVIASGGISRIEDIEHLLDLESDGVIGVITGRALYTGRLDLEEAIRISKKSQLVL